MINIFEKWHILIGFLHKLIQKELITVLTREKKSNFLLNAAFAAAIFALLFVLLKYALPVTLPFLIAAGLAYLLKEPIRKLRGLGGLFEKAAAPLCVTLVLGVLAAIVAFTVRTLAQEIAKLYVMLPSLLNSVPEYFARLSEGVSAPFSELDAGVLNAVQNFVEKFFSSLYTFLGERFMALFGSVGETAVRFIPSALIFIVVTIAATYFTAGDYSKLSLAARRVIGKKSHSALAQQAERICATLFSLLGSYLLILAITFAELFIGFFLIGVDYALTLALAIAFLDILPIVGVGTALIPYSLFSFISGDLRVGVSLLVLYLIITIVRQIIEPKIIGRRLGLPPLATLVSLYLGLQLFGLAGMALFPLALLTYKNYRRDKGQSCQYL